MILNIIRGFEQFFNNNNNNNSNTTTTTTTTNNNNNSNHNNNKNNSINNGRKDDSDGVIPMLKREGPAGSNNIIATITILFVVSSISYKFFKRNRQHGDANNNIQPQAPAQDETTNQPQPTDNARNQAKPSLSSTAAHGNPPEDFDSVYHGDTDDDSDVDEFGLPIRSSGGGSPESYSLLGNVDDSFWSTRC